MGTAKNDVDRALEFLLSEDCGPAVLVLGPSAVKQQLEERDE